MTGIVIGNDSSARIATIEAAMPTPATAPPKTIGLAAQVGADTTKYALPDHVHSDVTRWGRTNVTTNSSGFWSFQLPANRFVNLPGVFVSVKNSSGSYDYVASVTGTAAAGFTVAVQFTKRKDSLIVPLPAIILGAGALNLTVAASETGTAIGVVTFDIVCVEFPVDT